MAVYSDEVLASIRASFPDRHFPDTGIASWETLANGEDEEIMLQLRGRSWMSLAPSEVDGLPACFLTPEALAIALPALMTQILTSKRGLYRVREMGLATHMGPEALGALLTDDQKHALVRFLEFATQHGDSEAQAALALWQSE